MIETALQQRHGTPEHTFHHDRGGRGSVLTERGTAAAVADHDKGVQTNGGPDGILAGPALLDMALADRNRRAGPPLCALTGCEVGAHSFGMLGRTLGRPAQVFAAVWL